MTQIQVRTDNRQNLDVLLSAIDADTKLAEGTKYQYKRAVRNAVETGVDLLDGDALARYAETVSASERGFLRAGLKRLIDAERDSINALANPNAENVVELEARMAQASRKLASIEGAIESNVQKGQRDHTWLSQRQVKALLATCDRSTLMGLRDRLALALLVGAGLRRKEAAELTFSDVREKPIKGNLRTVLDINGKGDKHRQVPISQGLAQLIQDWSEAVGETESNVLRSFRRGGHVNGSLSTDALYNITRQRGAEIGVPELMPHDLRRTYAQIGYDAGIRIKHISMLLGHSSVKVTERYLNVHTDYEVTISDFVPVE